MRDTPMRWSTGDACLLIFPPLYHILEDRNEKSPSIVDLFLFPEVHTCLFILRFGAWFAGLLIVAAIMY
jgi:hypothetical protein